MLHTDPECCFATTHEEYIKNDPCPVCYVEIEIKLPKPLGRCEQQPFAEHEETEICEGWVPIVVDPSLPDDVVELRHGDEVVGRVENVATPSRLGRKGDTQAMPTINWHADIQSAVISDISKRREVGVERYGTALQPFNGRNALLDAYEEALDLCMYLKQALVERELAGTELAR